MDTIVICTFLGLPLFLIAATVVFIRRRHRSARPAGRGEIVLGNVLAILSLLGLTLLGAEVWFRYVRDTTDSFGNTRACARWYERHFHLNGQGFRDDVEYANEIEAGRRRLTILGDSFAAGHGVADVEDRFANRIRRARPDLEVHAMATPGSETGGQLDILRSAVRSGYETDIVVLAYCLNDLCDLVPMLGGKYRAAVRGMADKNTFVRHSYFLDFLDSRIRIQGFPIMRDYFGYVREAYRGPTWERQRRRLIALRRVVEERGGKLAIVVFPFLDRLDPYPMKEAHRALGAFAAAEGIPLLDLLPACASHRDEGLVVNAFDAHPNERAHEIAASEILGFLEAIEARE